MRNLHANFVAPLNNRSRIEKVDILIWTPSLANVKINPAWILTQF